MEYLKENEIKEIIIRYVENKNNNYAILIDGEWGSGKTYFIKNNVIPSLEVINKKTIYISLYGIRDTREIDRQIYFEILEKLTPKDKKVNFIKKGGKIVISGYKIINEALGGKLPMISSDNITGIISMFEEINKYILVFDDLERCNISPNVVLGYINNFVEHKNCKCIIIANQSEIAKVGISDNIEAKYLVALNKNIDFKEEKSNDLAKAFGIKNEQKEETKIEFSELKDRAEKLFNENIQYNQIKEKLIGNTIYYEPELEQVLKNIVEHEIKDTETQKIVSKYKKDIVELLESKRHINIRTLRIAINKFDQIIHIINTMNADKDEFLEEAIYNILIYTVYSTILNKTGENESKWEEFSEYGKTYIGIKKVVAFRFVDRLVNQGVLNEEYVKEVISKYIKDSKIEGNNLNDPLNKLLGYWELEDEIIIDNMEKLIKKLEKKEYKLEQYPKIVITMIRIKNFGFTKEYMDKVIELINLNIKNYESQESKFDEFGVMLNNEEESNEYNSIMQPIRDLLEEQSGKNRENKINDIFVLGNGWGEKFCDYCRKERNRMLTDRKFAKILDIEKLIKVIDHSKVQDISDFRRQIYTIYDFSNINEYYKEDIENLEKLKNGLEKLNMDLYGKSKIANIKWLIKNIDNILERLNM